MVEATLDYDTAKALLRPLASPILRPADAERCWSRRPLVDHNQQTLVHTILSDPRQTDLWNLPMLRIWDGYSGSQPNEHGRMLARAQRYRLDTRIARVKTLITHADNKDWTPTPYISFTTSPAALQDLAEMRRAQNKRGPQRLTLVDPRRRLSLGLPVLHYGDEMHFYGIADPYARNYEFFDNHYLCLWEVTPEEVVGTWDWDNLRTSPNWYQDIIFPALQVFRETENAASLIIPDALSEGLDAFDDSEGERSTQSSDEFDASYGDFNDSAYPHQDDLSSELEEVFENVLQI